jgi:alkanesulfonate monooxygenase SsuD/methylene tetrahydromethanopterin reductase-like flavin-dependent oxidoreductase (luciferase family)
MGRPVRFGVLFLPNVPWPVLRERVVRGEELGVEVAGLADHFVDWTKPPNPWFESWTALTGLAGATKTIRLASWVAQIALRNPAMLARQALTLDHVSGGRLEIGLGTGLVGDPSYPMIGVPDWEPRERVARLGEYVEIVDRLLRDEVTSFEGTFYRVEGAHVNPRPVQSPRPPITVAALGPVAMRIAARHADTWNSMSFLEGFDDQVDETRRRLDAMTGFCDAIGRDPSTLRRAYLMFDATARPRGGSIGYYESVGRFEDMTGRLLELGVDEVGLYYPLDEGQVPVFERIASDVLPRLRTGGPGATEPGAAASAPG